MNHDYWRPIAEFPNYEVSRQGEVYSHNRKKMLAQVTGWRGYMQVTLYRDGRAYNRLVHRLVAAAFLGPIPPGHQVNHKTPVKTMNDMTNLEIVTQAENQAHAVKFGLMHLGERNPRAKLTDAKVREMRRLRAEGMSVRKLAERFDLSERTIYMATRTDGKGTWKHVS